MAAIETIQIPLGFKAPEFNLLDVTSSKHSTYQELAGKRGTVVMFICNHCPFVVHVIDKIVGMANEYTKKGIGFIAINSNDIKSYPADSPENMLKFAQKHMFCFPYLFDESQETAKAYDAVCTPDFSVFDANNSCIYRGQLDESRPGNNIPTTGNELKKVLDCLLSNSKLSETQKPSIGCSIKWKV